MLENVLLLSQNRFEILNGYYIGLLCTNRFHLGRTASRPVDLKRNARERKGELSKWLEYVPCPRVAVCNPRYDLPQSGNL
jgi:hypothetical protein